MMWQPHHSGHALPPPPKGMDGSEDTQVELEHSCEQVKLRAILVIFNIFGFIENKRSSSTYLVCCYFKTSVK